MKKMVCTFGLVVEKRGARVYNNNVHTENGELAGEPAERELNRSDPRPDLGNANVGIYQEIDGDACASLFYFQTEFFEMILFSIPYQQIFPNVLWQQVSLT